jgi:tetratricopeptide (TPR) repeat protein
LRTLSLTRQSRVSGVQIEAGRRSPSVDALASSEIDRITDDEIMDSGPLRRRDPRRETMRKLMLMFAAVLLAAMPAMAQDKTAKIHGHIQDAVGLSVADATVIISDDPSMANPRYTFTTDANGDYKGEVKPGTYSISVRKAAMAKDKVLDQFTGVKILPGADFTQDFDMTRAEYTSKMTPEEKKLVEETRKKNADILKENAGIKQINANLVKAREANLRARAGSCVDNTGKAVAAHSDAAKCTADGYKPNVAADDYTEAEGLMQQSTAAMPTAPVLWMELGIAQAGLKKNDEAETSLKKALDLDASSKKPSPDLQGNVENTLGELYANQNKMPEASAAYDAAVKANPSMAGMYYTNQAIIYTRVNQSDAAAAAADKAIAADPTSPKAYYLKGQALLGKATIDEKTGKILPPPGCVEAYQKYLELAPTGPFAPDVKEVLAEVSSTVRTTYKAGKK